MASNPPLRVTGETQLNGGVHFNARLSQRLHESKAALFPRRGRGLSPDKRNSLVPVTDQLDSQLLQCGRVVISDVRGTKIGHVSEDLNQPDAVIPRDAEVFRGTAFGCTDEHVGHVVFDHPLENPGLRLDVFVSVPVKHDLSVSGAMTRKLGNDFSVESVR